MIEEKTQWQLNLREWQRLYGVARDRAERITKMRYERARQACAAAGLDPGLLGVHPHNAMVSYSYGKPWPGVNYSLVRRCLWLMKTAYESSRILERYNTRLWNRLMYPLGACKA
jgi:hypothetical protein